MLKVISTPQFKDGDGDGGETYSVNVGCENCLNYEEKKAILLGTPLKEVACCYCECVGFLMAHSVPEED